MAYDITDRKRLKRVAKLLLRYGHRVQKSVFACDINERRRRELEAKLKLEKQHGDSIMIYEYAPESAEEIKQTTGTGGGNNSIICQVRPGTESASSRQRRMSPLPKTQKNAKKTEKGRKKPSGRA